MNTVMQCKSCSTVLVFPEHHDKPKRCHNCGSQFLREGTAGPIKKDRVLKVVDEYLARGGDDVVFHESLSIAERERLLNGKWIDVPSGPSIMADVKAMIAKLHADTKHGPLTMFMPGRNLNVMLDTDFYDPDTAYKVTEEGITVMTPEDEI